MSLVLVTLWVFFQEALEVVVTESQIVTIIDAIASVISTYAGIAIPYGRAVTVATVGVVTVLAFAWGYVFHVSRFGRPAGRGRDSP